MLRVKKWKGIMTRLVRECAGRLFTPSLLSSLLAWSHHHISLFTYLEPKIFTTHHAAFLLVLRGAGY